MCGVSEGGRFAVVMVVDIFHSARQRYYLLHQADHAAILAGCRQMLVELSDQPSDGEDKIRMEVISDPTSDPRVPEVLRTLKPAHICVFDHCVRIEMHGGFDHYGLVGYAEGEEPQGGELIPGLCYYSE